MVIATGEITVVDLHDEDIHIGATPPDDMKDGRLWLDNSTVPNVLKRWDAATQKWVKASPTSVDDIGAEPVIIKSSDDPAIVKAIFTRNSAAVDPTTGMEIPTDTPVFLPFIGSRKGLLSEEGVENLLPINQSSFEASSVAQSATRFTHEKTTEWSKHGDYSQKIIRSDDTIKGSYMWYRCPIAGQGFAVGTPFTAQTVLYLPPECWYIGKSITSRIRFAGGTQAVGALITQTFTLNEGENLLWATDELDYSDRQWVEYFIWDIDNTSPGGTFFYTDCHMVHVGTYPLSWHVGVATRANSLTRMEMPAVLPPDFGIGLAVKMMHDNAVKDRVFWTAGDYTCFQGGSKVKLTNGVVATEVGATWDAGDIVGIYAGRKDGKLFVQGNVAGEMTGLIRVTGDGVIGVDEIIIGSNSEGETGEPSGHVNGVIADFAYHFTPEKIDPASYLAKVPDGGGAE